MRTRSIKFKTFEFMNNETHIRIIPERKQQTHLSINIEEAKRLITWLNKTVYEEEISNVMAILSKAKEVSDKDPEAAFSNSETAITNFLCDIGYRKMIETYDEVLLR